MSTSGNATASVSPLKKGSRRNVPGANVVAPKKNERLETPYADLLIATPYALSAHERGQLGPVDYLAGPGDVWESRLKAEGTRF